MLVLAAGAESAVDHVVGIDGDSQGHVVMALGGECELFYRVRKKITEQPLSLIKP